MTVAKEAFIVSLKGFPMVSTLLLLKFKGEGGEEGGGGDILKIFLARG